MSRFLKLTNVILNTKFIHKIDITPNKYIISVVPQEFSGSGWNVGWFGLSQINTHNYNVVICKTEKPDDYKQVFDWINKLE